MTPVLVLLTTALSRTTEAPLPSASMVLEFTNSAWMTSPLAVVASRVPALTAERMLLRKSPPALPTMVPLLIRVRVRSPRVPAPEIVLLRFVSVDVPPLSVMTLFPPGDRDSVPPPESFTLPASSNVAPLTALVPCSLIEPALVTAAAPSVRVPPSNT